MTSKDMGQIEIVSGVPSAPLFTPEGYERFCEQWEDEVGPKLERNRRERAQAQVQAESIILG